MLAEEGKEVRWPYSLARITRTEGRPSAKRTVIEAVPPPDGLWARYVLRRDGDEWMFDYVGIHRNLRAAMRALWERRFASRFAKPS
jgi:hypothetical protein